MTFLGEIKCVARDAFMKVRSRDNIKNITKSLNLPTFSEYRRSSSGCRPCLK